jgi:hypothetical protein
LAGCENPGLRCAPSGLRIPTDFRVPFPPVIASAAKTSMAASREVDCFATLAMTVDIVSPSRGVLRPSFASSFALLENRGRREDRVLAAPAVSRAICANKTAHEHTGQREHSSLPCAMALRLTSCSSRRTALLPPLSAGHRARSEGSMRNRQLNASTAAPEPHDFTVRIRRARPARHPRPSHLTARS